jgi:hypothetical protein
VEEKVEENAEVDEDAEVEEASVVEAGVELGVVEDASEAVLCTTVLVTLLVIITTFI